jgi:hypothetical protein
LPECISQFDEDAVGDIVLVFLADAVVDEVK